MNTLFDRMNPEGDDAELERLRATNVVQARKERVLEAAAANEHFYATLFLRAVRRLAETHQPFTSEDVIKQVGTPHPKAANQNNGIGAWMHASAKKGLIRKTGRMLPAKRGASHGRELREWMGVVR